MKKLILFLFIVLFCISCTSVSNDEWNWAFVNRTDRILKIKWHNNSGGNEISEYQIDEIKPNGFIKMYHVTTSVKKSLYFNYYFDKSVESYGEDVYWQILSEDDEILKTWSYSGKKLPDQRFFEESSWHYDQDSGEWYTWNINTWTFEILPEDIQSAN